MTPTLIVRKQFAFCKRGFLLDASYKLSLILGVGQTFASLILFYFISKLVDSTDPRLTVYDSSYFGFACVGVAMSQYFARGLAACGSSLRRAQLSGVLEAILSTQTKPIAVVVHDAIYQFGVALLDVFIVIACSVVLFGLDLSRANWPVALMGFVIASFVFLGLSILSAAVILRIKNRDPVQMVLGTAGSFVAGAYFPVTLLPPWLQTFAHVLPMTHALEVLRGSLLRGDSLAQVSSPLAIMLAMGLVTVPVGAYLFSRAVEKSRRDGTLLQY